MGMEFKVDVRRNYEIDEVVILTEISLRKYFGLIDTSELKGVGDEEIHFGQIGQATFFMFVDDWAFDPSNPERRVLFGAGPVRTQGSLLLMLAAAMGVSENEEACIIDEGGILTGYAKVWPNEVETPDDLETFQGVAAWVARRYKIQFGWPENHGRE